MVAPPMLPPLKPQINQLIYKLYDLTEEEIKIIKKMFLSWNIYNIQKRKFAGKITEEEAEK